MNFTLLKEKFKMEKQYDANTMNELLDYAKRLYLHDEMNITEYRQLIKLLEDEGAKNPEQLA